MRQPADPKKIELLELALNHVAFDGWAPTVFDAAVSEIGMDPAHAKTLCPRGAIDLAILFHHLGDDAMIEAMETAELSEMRYSEKVAHAIWLRINAVSDKEAVRRGTVLFALPHMAPEGAKLIWGTADKIWTALGDTSDDANWYTKRATLSAVYSSVVLFWLGDTSDTHQATRDFIDRRIENVMQFEKFKSQVNGSAALKPLTGAISKLMSGVRAPTRIPDHDLPGMWRGQD